MSYSSTVTSIILSSNKIQKGDLPVPAYMGCAGNLLSFSPGLSTSNPHHHRYYHQHHLLNVPCPGSVMSTEFMALALAKWYSYGMNELYLSPFLTAIFQVNLV